MASTKQSDRATMTLDTAVTFIAAANCFRTSDPGALVEGVNFRTLCALALVGLSRRYDLEDPVSR